MGEYNPVYSINTKRVGSLKCVSLSINYTGNYCNTNKFVHDIYHPAYVIYTRTGFFFFGSYYGEIHVYGS